MSDHMHCASFTTLTVLKRDIEFALARVRGKGERSRIDVPPSVEQRGMIVVRPWSRLPQLRNQHLDLG